MPPASKTARSNTQRSLYWGQGPALPVLVPLISLAGELRQQFFCVAMVA